LLDQVPNIGLDSDVADLGVSANIRRNGFRSGLVYVGYDD
jgi:hypothetical protein